jgi:hypothetical protein
LKDKTSDKDNTHEDVIKYFISNGFIEIDEDAKTIKFNIRDTNNLIKFLNIKELPSSISIF